MKRKYGMLVNRDTYRKIKRCNHVEFEDFCRKLYENGYNDGRESVPGTDLEAIMEKIRGVKGIGEKRMEQIEGAVAVLLENQEGGGENAAEV